MEQKGLGWRITNIITILLFLIMFAGIWLENIPVIYGTFAVLMIMAIVARVIRGKKRRQKRLEEEANAALKQNYTA